MVKRRNNKSYNFYIGLIVLIIGVTGAGWFAYTNSDSNIYLNPGKKYYDCNIPEPACIPGGEELAHCSAWIIGSGNSGTKGVDSEERVITLATGAAVALCNNALKEAHREWNVALANFVEDCKSTEIPCPNCGENQNIKCKPSGPSSNNAECTVNTEECVIGMWGALLYLILIKNILLPALQEHGQLWEQLVMEQLENLLS
jgi:predicted RNA-binding Zn-ribbon protein involved in translation (DUF1610 family)